MFYLSICQLLRDIAVFYLLMALIHKKYIKLIHKWNFFTCGCLFIGFWLYLQQGITNVRTKWAWATNYWCFIGEIELAVDFYFLFIYKCINSSDFTELSPLSPSPKESRKSLSKLKAFFMLLTLKYNPKFKHLLKWFCTYEGIIEPSPQFFKSSTPWLSCITSVSFDLTNLSRQQHHNSGRSWLLLFSVEVFLWSTKQVRCSEAKLFTDTQLTLFKDRLGYFHACCGPSGELSNRCLVWCISLKFNKAFSVLGLKALWKQEGTI